MADQCLQSAYGEIFKPGRPEASNLKRALRCVRSAPRARPLQASRGGGFRGSELVAEIFAEDLHGVARQAACVPSSAWRKRDLSNAPSHDGNTSGSRVEETLRTTSTGPSAVCNIVTAASSSRICLTVAVWRKPHVRAMPARSTPALVWVGCIPVSP